MKPVIHFVTFIGTQAHTIAAIAYTTRRPVWSYHRDTNIHLTHMIIGSNLTINVFWWYVYAAMKWIYEISHEMHHQKWNIWCFNFIKVYMPSNCTYLVRDVRVASQNVWWKTSNLVSMMHLLLRVNFKNTIAAGLVMEVASDGNVYGVETIRGIHFGVILASKCSSEQFRKWPIGIF